jgi:ribonuclease P/MRP protein subunit RPP1
MDLVLCEDKFENLGFSKVYNININKITNESQLKRLNDKLIIVEGGELNREILSKKNVDILLSPEKNRREDFLHHRNSGLNHILCKIAYRNKIIIGFSFNEILKSNEVKRAKILGRMKQNIKLCRKYKVNMIVGSFANNKYEMRSLNDLKSFARVIGMNSLEVKKAFSLIQDIFKNKQGFISEGIKILD